MLIGCSPGEMDRVYMYDSEAGLVLLEESIFDFFANFKGGMELEDLNKYNIDPKDLYRNIGEDFWRVHKRLSEE